MRAHFPLLAITAVAMLSLLQPTRSCAQAVADPGFKSVGRGAPLLVSLPPSLPVGVQLTPQNLPEVIKDLRNWPFVGPIKLNISKTPIGRSAGAIPELVVGAA
jgi:hypothetical protein